MSGNRDVFRRGRGRHRRRRRAPLKTVLTVSVLMACSAFMANAVNDDTTECGPLGNAVNPSCPGQAAAKRVETPAGKAGSGGGGGTDGMPRDGDGAGAAPRPRTPEAEGVYDRERCGNTSGRVLLTLDDWPYNDPQRSVRIGAQLQAQGVRAAFFLIGKFAAQYPQITATLRQQGHWVGNHSYTHRKLTALDDDVLTDEIRLGVGGNMLRPPYGAADEREREAAAELGYRVCNWTVDTHDWEKVDGQPRSVEDIRASVRNATQEEKHNGVILGHLFSNFPEALPGIISDLQSQGYGVCRNNGPVGDQVPYPLDC
ncbi:polysaccharide deacetylase family protein [Streptomyces sp. SCA3-4]|uniref:polysaccharide deacetylase family protein n=1 Tax=Streptomyces sichuanensis TaxID=2871810 RepID=UPI001CE36073|nr:polysaccharide deacetylase family protein [Streptomyces sichuanensis]MCA6094556.1 polysaccharide deacetylase family protein [Streptomyces sichuanensis]